MVYYILPSIPIILKNIMKKYSSVVHVSGHEISTTNHLNKTGNTYVTKVKFGRLIPFINFYHTKKRFWKNIRLLSTYIVTKFPHVSCLISHVSCLMSHVSCLMSHVSCLKIIVHLSLTQDVVVVHLLGRFLFFL